VWGKGEVIQEFSGERYHLENLGVHGRVILKWIFNKWDGKAWNELLWPRLGAGGGRL
jgi:hypothetical protein